MKIIIIFTKKSQIPLLQNRAVEILGTVPTQLGAKMTIWGIFRHHRSTFPSKTATALLTAPSKAECYIRELRS